jgi:hypothetical protein
MKTKQGWMVCLMVAALWLAPRGAWAQALEPEAEEALRDQGSERARAASTKEDALRFGAGSIDLMLGAGMDFGGLFYPHIEPGVDIGLIPVGEDVTLSLGASVDLGYCLFCSLVNFAASATGTDLTVQSYYIAPTARALAHFNFISKILQVPELDLSAGVLVSPSLYTFRLEYGDGQLDENTLLFSAGPVLGGRYILDSGLMLFIEYRYLVTFGASKVSVSTSSGDSYTFDTGTVGRYGQSYAVGIGYRI